METDRGKRPVSLADADYRSARIRGRKHTRGVPLGARGPPGPRVSPLWANKEGRCANTAPPLSDSRLASPSYS